MLTEDTCVTEPVDTAQREKTVRAGTRLGGGAGEERGRPRLRANSKALPLQGAGATGREPGRAGVC